VGGSSGRHYIIKRGQNRSVFEGSQAVPACPPSKGSMDRGKEVGSEQSKALRKTLSKVFTVFDGNLTLALEGLH
jgi:hypothetical protein